MFTRIFSVCLFLCLCRAGSSLSCRWMTDQFRKFSNDSLTLLDTMANNSNNTTEDAELDGTVSFPNRLYSQASKASAEDKLGFTVQVLEEVSDLLLSCDHSSASWEKITEEHFLMTIIRQVEGLCSCIGSHKKKNKKLHMYFKRLSHQIPEQMGHSAEAWEVIRKEIKTHLMRVDLMVSTVL